MVGLGGDRGSLRRRFLVSGVVVMYCGGVHGAKGRGCMCGRMSNVTMSCGGLFGVLVSESVGGGSLETLAKVDDGAMAGLTGGRGIAVRMVRGVYLNVKYAVSRVTSFVPSSRISTSVGGGNR